MVWTFVNADVAFLILKRSTPGGCSKMIDEVSDRVVWRIGVTVTTSKRIIFLQRRICSRFILLISQQSTDITSSCLLNDHTFVVMLTKTQSDEQETTNEVPTIRKMLILYGFSTPIGFLFSLQTREPRLAGY